MMMPISVLYRIYGSSGIGKSLLAHIATQEICQSADHMTYAPVLQLHDCRSHTDLKSRMMENMDVSAIEEVPSANNTHWMHVIAHQLATECKRE